MSQRFLEPRVQVSDSNGDPLPGAKLAFYVTGTSTPKNTYSDSALTTPNANPVVADSAGRFGDIYLDTAASDYKVVLSSASDVVVWTADPWAGALPVASLAELQARATNKKVVTPARLGMGLGLKGADIASGASIAIPDVGDYFSLTGSATVVQMTFGTGTVDGREFELICSAAPSFTHNATSLICLGGVSITAAAGDIIRFRREGSGDNVRMVGYAAAATSPIGGGALPRGYVDGFLIANDTTDATNDIQVAIGAARDDTNASNLVTAATILKQLDVAFAEYSSPSTTSGGRDVDFSIADGWWHVYMIGGTGKNTQPFMSTSTAPNLPTGFTTRRRVGSIHRTGGAIRAFVQNGDQFIWKASILDVNATNPGTSAVLRTLTVPIDVKVQPIINQVLVSSSVNTQLYVSSPDQNDEAVSLSAAPLFQNPAYNVGNAAFGMLGGILRTDTSSQIRTRLLASDANTVLRIATLGWVDSRGRDA